MSRLHSLPPRRTCRFAVALLHPDVLPKSRLAPVSTDLAHTTAHRLHASDHTRPNSATVLGSRIPRRRSPPGDVSYGLEDSSHPPSWLGWLPRTRHRSVLDTADHLEKATALLHTVGLVLLSTNVGAPTAPFSRLPWPEPFRYTRPPTVPLGQLFRLPTSVLTSTTTFPSFPNRNKPTGNCSRPSS